MKALCSVLFGALLLASGFILARAEVRLPLIFQNGMVLQRDMPLPVWGRAGAGEAIAVSIAGRRASTTAGPDGKWLLKLPPLPASIEPQTLTVQGWNTLVLHDVLVGEVWLCSGQSNMTVSMSDPIKDRARELAAANQPHIRLFRVAMSVERAWGGAPAERWEACTPETVKPFSAVAIFFGRELHQALGVPVGLIQSAMGGTPGEAWTPREALLADPELKRYFPEWEQKISVLPGLERDYLAARGRWETQAATARAAAHPQPPAPTRSLTARPASEPGELFNNMIDPLIPFGLRGVIWYQGESNAGSAEQAARYGRLFPALIQGWRRFWGQGDFPFLYVQLANYLPRRTTPTDSTWARLRESQLKTLAVPGTAMAVAIDAGEGELIHPPDKQTVSHRLALAALNRVYGKMNVDWSGPVFEKLECRDGKAVLHFRHGGGGLVNKAEGGLKGFAIAGADKRFVWGEARIEGDTVVVASPQVKVPVAVRYGWADNPEVGLYNQAGLPASPFRTDNWPFAPKTPASDR